MTSITSAYGPRRGLGLATVAAIAVLLASGCAQNAPARPWGNAPAGPEAELHEAVDCRSEPSSLPPNAEEATADPSIPVPGRVPEGFEASAAVRCSVEFGELAQVGEGRRRD